MRKLTQLCTRGTRGVCLIFVCAFAAAQLIMHGRCMCMRCVSKCAQIMLIIVTQLAREGHGKRGGRGASQLNPNGCIPRQKRPQTIPCSGTAAAVAGGANSAIFSFLSLFVFPPPSSLFPSVFFISHALYESHFMHAKLVYVRNFKRSVKS